MQQNGAAAVAQAPNISVQRSQVSSAIQDVRVGAVLILLFSLTKQQIQLLHFQQ